MKKKILLILAVAIIASVLSYLFAPNFLFTSVTLPEKGNPTEKAGSSPKFNFRPSGSKNITKNGKTYDFGLIKAGDTLEGEAFLNLIDDVKSEFSVSLVSATEFDGQKNVPDWLELPEGKIVAIPGSKDGKKNIPFRVNVPKDLLPGEYSVLLQAALDNYEGLTLSKGSSRIKIAVGFMINFGIEGERRYEMNLAKTEYDKNVLEKDKILNIDFFMNNKGNAKLFPMAHITISGRGGSYAEKDISFNECLAGSNCTGKINEKLEQVKSIDRIAINTKLYYSTKKDGDKTLVAKSSFVHYIIPWKYVLPGFGVIILALSIFFLFRGRRMMLLSNSQKYIVLPGDNLESVTRKFNTDAKKIITANKLKSPYFLTPGGTIYIPKK